MIQYILVRFVIASILIIAFIVLTQDFQIFPGIFSAKVFNYRSVPGSDVQESIITSKDGQKIFLWKREVKQNARKQVVLIFHGNAESLASVRSDQQWMASLGFTNYVMEYRGYNGRNSGWPSERGFYEDAETSVDFILREEKLEPHNLIVIGKSIGTGTAAYTAQKFNARILILLAPYTGLKDLIGEMPFLGYLTPFVRYNFPTKTFVQNLKSTDVILAHGKEDITIPFHHSEQLNKEYKGQKSITFIQSAEAGHNDLLAYTSDQIGKKLIALIAEE